MVRIMRGVAVLPFLVPWHRGALAQGDGVCDTPSYPCDETLFCTPCPLEPPPGTLTGSGDEIAPVFDESPGTEKGAEVLGTLFPALARTFDYGRELGDYEVDPGEIDEWADEAGDGFEQSELPQVTEERARQRRTQPAFPVPPDEGVIIPIDQGAPRTPSQDGEPNDNDEARDHADPVDPANGELYIEHTDLSFPGFGVSFELRRTYRSRIDYAGVMGPGWDFNFNRRLLNLPDSRRRSDAAGPEPVYESVGQLPQARTGLLGDPDGALSASCGPQVVLMTGNGTTLRFRQVGENGTTIYYESAEGARLELRGHKSAGNITWSLTDPTGMRQTFDELGLMASSRDANGIGLEVEWESAPTSDWRVAAVSDSVGRVIELDYLPSGLLSRVSEPTSGLEARYTYASGQLASATDSTGRIEKYEYDLDSSRAAGDWGPEGFLVPACELACAPSGSSCDAGGACDEPVQQATDSCMASCHLCGLGCFFGECGRCADTCREGVDGDPGCRDICETDCSSDESGSDVAVYCQQAWVEHGAPACSACEDECEAADSECHWATYCIQAAGGFDEEASGDVDVSFLGSCLDIHNVGNVAELVWDSVQVGIAGILDTLGCVAGTVCSWTRLCGEPDCDWRNVKHEVEELCEQNYRQCCRDGEECGEGSCNSGHGCFEDCRAAFLGQPNGNGCESPDGIYSDADAWVEANGCEARLTANCEGRCANDCTDDCTADCLGVCASACAEACHSDDCAGYCDSLDLMGSCQAGCVEGCIETAHQEGPYVGPKYGYPRDLNHNILRIRDGNNDVYLQVTYGTDLSRPDFDAVVAQTYGDFTGQIAYRDLEGEERGVVAPPTSGPAATYIDSRADFEPVEICPSACSPVGPLPAREYVAADGLLLEFASSSQVGGLSLDQPRLTSPLAPNVLILTQYAPGRLFARSMAEASGGGDPPGGREPFAVNLPGGKVTFTPAANRSFSLQGPAAALESLRGLGMVTAFTDASGRFRVYPGHPTSLVRIASGWCREPFQATVVSSQLRITPATACSPELTVVPLATARTETGTKGDVQEEGRRALDGFDLFRSSAVVPIRQSVSWRAVSGSLGRYAAFQGTDARGGDVHRAAALNAGLNLPLSVMPPAQDALAPLFIYHDTTNLVAPDRASPGARNAYFDGAPALVLDAPAYAGEPRSSICNPARPGPIQRGIGERPSRAAVMVDFYGVAWTYYFDRAGRIIRRVNNATQATRSVNYDAAGQVDGVEEPGGRRACFHYDEYGNVLDVFDFPRPGAMGRTEPIRYRYSWKINPVRLEAIFDPRGTNLITPPAAVLARYEYDTAGNLKAVQNAAGERIELTLVGGTGPDRAMPARRTDPDGAITKFEYDQSTGGLAHVLVGAGRPDVVETQTVFDPAGRPVFEVSPMGEETTLDWTGGRLTSVTSVADDLEETTSFTYDANSQIATESRQDRKIEYFYDLIGGLRRVRTSALDGSAPTTNRCTRHGPAGRLLEDVSPEGDRRRYAYDGEGRITSVEAGSLSSSGAWDDGCLAGFSGLFAAGTVAAMTYSPSGNLNSVTDARGLAIHLVPDGFDRTIQILGSGSYALIGYDELGNEMWSSLHVGLPNGPYGPPQWGQGNLRKAKETFYDAIGRPTQRRTWHFSAGVAVGDGYATTTFGYDAASRTVTVTDDADAATTYTTDAAGRLKKIVLPTDAVVTQQYLDGGRTVARTWPAPTPSGQRHETTGLTAWGAVASVETADAGGTVLLESYDYDEHRRLVAATDGAGKGTMIAYDAFDQPRLETQVQSGVAIETVELGWDRNGWLKLRTSDSGVAEATTGWNYDALGRLREETDPLGAKTTTTYVLRSTAPSTATDPRGVVTSYHYDAAGNLDGETAAPPSGPAQQRTFTWDAAGNLEQAVRAGGLPSWAPSTITTVLTWDSLGNRLSEQDTSSKIAGRVVHSYTGRGLLRRSTYGDDDRRIDRNYDELGRLTSVGPQGSLEPLVSFTYGTFGPAIHRQDHHNGPTNGTDYSYDPLGRLEKIVTKNAAGSVLARWRYELGLDGVPRVAISKLGALPEVASVYTADSAGRLRSETHDLSGLASLVLAPTASTAAANAAVEPYAGTGSTWKRYNLDGRHNFTRVALPGRSFDPIANAADAYTQVDGQTPTYDAAGNLKNLGSTTYTYDAFGDLSHVDAGPSARRSYVRDAFGRVVLERNESTGAGDPVTRYAHDGARRHYRQRPDGAKEFMIDGQGLDEHLVRLGGTAYSYHQDRTGNVFLVTDPDGNPVESYRYTAYGDTTIQSPSGQPLPDSAIANVFGFQGHPFDKQAGLIDMRRRAYSPTLGRFLNRDPIGLAGGTNLYAFVDSSPLLYTDPFGLEKLGAEQELGRCRDGLHCSLQVGINHFFSDRRGRFMRSPAGELTRFASREAFSRVLESNVDMERIRANPNLSRTAFAPPVVPEAMKVFVAVSVIGAASRRVPALAVLVGGGSGTDEGTALLGAFAGLLGGRRVSAAPEQLPAPTIAAGGGLRTFHGTDIASARNLLAGEGLSTAKAAAGKIDGPAGFYLATDADAATYFALRRGEGAILKFDFSAEAASSLSAKGAVLRPIPAGGMPGGFPGMELFIPPEAFGLFNDLRAGGQIVVTPH